MTLFSGHPIVLGLIVGSILLTLAGQAGLPIGALRAPAGMVLALLAPGYAALLALRPRRLTGLTALVLSVPLSLAVLVILGVIFNATPLGLRPDPLAVAMAVVSLALLAIGWWRDRSVGPGARRRRAPSQSLQRARTRLTGLWLSGAAAVGALIDDRRRSLGSPLRRMRGQLGGQPTAWTVAGGGLLAGISRGDAIAGGALLGVMLLALAWTVFGALPAAVVAAAALAALAFGRWRESALGLATTGRWSPGPPLRQARDRLGGALQPLRRWLSAMSTGDAVAGGVLLGALLVAVAWAAFGLLAALALAAVTAAALPAASRWRDLPATRRWSPGPPLRQGRDRLAGALRQGQDRLGGALARGREWLDAVLFPMLERLKRMPTGDAIAAGSLLGALLLTVAWAAFGLLAGLALAAAASAALAVSRWRPRPAARRWSPGPLLRQERGRLGRALSPMRDRLNRIPTGNIVAGGALLGALALALAWAAFGVLQAARESRPAFSELYVSSATMAPAAAGGQAELDLLVGVANHEPQAMSYTIRVLVHADGAAPRVATEQPITVPAGETWRGPITGQVPCAGRVELQLAKAAQVEPYRRLQLRPACS
jgi:uncharacterized membrane protein